MPHEAIQRTRLCRAATTVGYLGGEGGTVANWRRKALALFSDLRHDVQRPDFSVYRRSSSCCQKHAKPTRPATTSALGRIYGFAEWCLEQKANDMWNAAGVAFYEHLFDDHPSLRPEVVEWLSPAVINGVWGLWEWRLPAEQLAEVKRLIERRWKRFYPEAHLTGGNGGPARPTAELG